MNSLSVETLGVVGTFVVTMAGLMKIGMVQHRRLADQFVTFLESMTTRMMDSLDELTDRLGANTLSLEKLLMRQDELRMGMANAV